MNADRIIKLLHENNVFLTGKAGTGKSWITREIIRKACNPIVLGSTGMAAMGIGGSTVHSFFKLGMSNNLTELRAYDEYRLKQLKSRKYSAATCHKYMYGSMIDALKIASLIIIDEISMLSKDVLDLVFTRLDEFSPHDIPILVVGDFYQLPPVNAEYAFKSENWNFITVELKDVRRTENKTFAEVQSRVRVGKIDDETLDFINQLSKNTVKNPLKIFSRNIDVDNENQRHLSEIEGDAIDHPTSFNVYTQGDQAQIVNSLLNDLRIDKVFTFKLGARAMAIVNDGDKLANGLLGTITNFDGDVITFLTDAGAEIEVKRYRFKKLAVETSNGKIVMKEIAAAEQFPLVIAAAITIHKSQGLTIDRLAIDCSRIFERGQFYVAFSRGVDPKNISLTSFDQKYITGNPVVDEFYKSVT